MLVLIVPLLALAGPAWGHIRDFPLSDVTISDSTFQAKAAASNSRYLLDSLDLDRCVYARTRAPCICLPQQGHQPFSGSASALVRQQRQRPAQILGWTGHRAVLQTAPRPQHRPSCHQCLRAMPLVAIAGYCGASARMPACRRLAHLMPAAGRTQPASYAGISLGTTCPQ